MIIMMRRKCMSTMVEFSVVPVGKGTSISTVIADVMKIIVASGVSYRANAMGTILEGEWDAVMGVVKNCHDLVMQDADRAITTIKIDDRKGKDARMGKKLEAVEKKLGMILKK
jgi:uncharacterized protein (TIGR00106 family)